jgi:hypothetical protein
MSTFYATFSDLDSARGTIRALLASGLTSDDVSVVARVPHGISGTFGEITETGRLADATTLVGRSDDPADFGQSQGLGLQPESAIGGGIATITSDDDVSEVSEMDDSQSAAEDLNSPFVATRAAVSDPDHDSDDSLEEVTIPGFGIVLGSGALATAALIFANHVETEGLSALEMFLRSEGVPAGTAAELVLVVHGGGAIIAVAIAPADTNPMQVEEVAMRHGATSANLFDGLRY